MLSLRIHPQDAVVKSGKTLTREIDIDSTRDADVQVVLQTTVKGKTDLYALKGRATDGDSEDNAQTTISVIP